MQFLEIVRHLEPALDKRLRSLIQKRTFEKDQTILEIDEIASDIFFINSGMVRSYYVHNDKEVTNWFMRERDVCISILSFLRQKPSVDRLVALEPCVCHGIKHAELYQLYDEYMSFNIHGRIILEEYYCRAEERAISLRRQTPEEKYRQLLENDPDLLARVPNKYMASYLDVSDSTYSRIRKKFQQGTKKK